MEPGVIRKLDEVVVNRIAAGEILQRPANAVKELIENSLDAKASYIQVTVKEGGLKQLQIQDNGTGIRRDDLAIVCERFTTSKLTKFDDLANIGTFGFRGEALASISHIAHLTIQTKTAQDRCGYKAGYEDGKLKTPPKPCAGNQGTIITIEDLFYNMPQRKQGLKKPAEEFQKISDVLAKYAVHNSRVAFTLKKFGEQPSLKTGAGSTLEQNIRSIFGAQISEQLLHIRLDNEVHKFAMNGLITKVNYAAKKSIMLLFINHRLVESPSLKTALDTVYATYLPKGMHPFIYMSLELEPTNVDVNVHPTKHEVHFLYEDEIVESVKSHVEAQLLGSNATRTFYKQLKLPGVSDEMDASGQASTSIKINNSERVYAKEMIRTDAKEQKLEKFLVQKELPGSLVKTDSGMSNSSIASVNSDAFDESFRAVAARKSKEVRLTSVLNMQKRVENGCSVQLRKTMKEMVFVGVVDKTFALFQQETRLALCNTIKFSEELFYQRLVYGFQNFSSIKIEPNLKITDLLLIALNSEESGWTQEDGAKAELADQAASILSGKANLMREYFAVDFTDNGELASLPALLDKHVPCSTFLPLYLLRLATEVEWEAEEECFETFCRETAMFYSRVSELQILSHPKQHKWVVENVIYPAFKKYLLPTPRLKEHMYELTSLPTLYRVFERC